MPSSFLDWSSGQIGDFQEIEKFSWVGRIYSISNRECSYRRFVGICDQILSWHGSDQVFWGISKQILAGCVADNSLCVCAMDDWRYERHNMSWQTVDGRLRSYEARQCNASPYQQAHSMWLVTSGSYSISLAVSVKLPRILDVPLRERAAREIPS